jgi:hypothetical protein
MAWANKWLSTGLGLSLTLAGCATSPNSCCDCHPKIPGRSADVLPVCYRAELADGANVGLLVTAYSDSLRNPRALPIYRCLGVQACQCLAVEASPLGNVLDREAQIALQQAEARKLGRDKARQAATFKAQMLTYLAQEDRNRSAGRALDAYFNLGEAEAGADILQSSLVQVADALAKARALKATGLPADDASLYRQQLDLQARGAKLQIQIQQLNSELRTLLGFESCPAVWQFSPVDAFHLVADPLDPDEAVAVGLSHRPELLLLRRLEDELCAGNLDSVGQQLRALSAALGQGPAAHFPKLQQLLAKLCASSDATPELRRQQVSEYRAARERAVAEEIRQAVQTVQGQLSVVVLTAQRADSLHDAVKEAEEKEVKGADGFAQTTEAKVEWHKARRDVVSEISRLQRAKVQVRRAQGILPAECSRAGIAASEDAACVGR